MAEQTPAGHYPHVHAGEVGASELERALARVAALAGPDQLVPALEALADALAAGIQPIQLRSLAVGLADGMRKGGDRS
jgi:hypothetical protein